MTAFPIVEHLFFGGKVQTHRCDRPVGRMAVAGPGCSVPGSRRRRRRRRIGGPAAMSFRGSSDRSGTGGVAREAFVRNSARRFGGAATATEDGDSRGVVVVVVVAKPVAAGGRIWVLSQRSNLPR